MLFLLYNDDAAAVAADDNYYYYNYLFLFFSRPLKHKKHGTSENLSERFSVLISLIYRR